MRLNNILNQNHSNHKFQQLYVVSERLKSAAKKPDKDRLRGAHWGIFSEPRAESKPSSKQNSIATLAQSHEADPNSSSTGNGNETQDCSDVRQNSRNTNDGPVSQCEITNQNKVIQLHALVANRPKAWQYEAQSSVRARGYTPNGGAPACDWSRVSSSLAGGNAQGQKSNSAGRSVYFKTQDNFPFTSVQGSSQSPAPGSVSEFGVDAGTRVRRECAYQRFVKQVIPDAEFDHFKKSELQVSFYLRQLMSRNSVALRQIENHLSTAKPWMSQYIIAEEDEGMSPKLEKTDRSSAGPAKNGNHSNASNNDYNCNNCHTNNTSNTINTSNSNSNSNGCTNNNGASVNHELGQGQLHSKQINLLNQNQQACHLKPVLVDSQYNRFRANSMQSSQKPSARGHILKPLSHLLIPSKPWHQREAAMTRGGVRGAQG